MTKVAPGDNQSAMLDSFQKKPAIVGMLHLPALAGSPLAKHSLDQILSATLDDAKILADAGFHGFILENFGDLPFFPTTNPPWVLTQMTRIACAVKSAYPHLPLGINVLRNDAKGALAVAHASGADFIRVNVLSGSRLTDQGWIDSPAAELLRLRRTLEAQTVSILADVDVKHSAALGSVSLKQQAEEALERCLADGVIASGPGTAKETSLEDVREIRSGAGKKPVWIGSGVRPDNIEPLLAAADGLIIGSCLKKANVLSPVQPKAAERIMELCNSFQHKPRS